MKLTGQHTIDVDRQRVWDALEDPAVLARTLPGCRSLQVTGSDPYAATITAGVASVQGTYQGKVALAELQAPACCTLVASGAGVPGSVQAQVGEVFHAATLRPAPGPDDHRLQELGLAVIVGAAIALVGVLIGHRLAR